MDLNGGRRRIPLIEEPRRPPWMLIVPLVGGAVVILWLLSNLHLGFRDTSGGVSPHEAAMREDRIEVRAAEAPTVPHDAASTADGRPRNPPRWAYQAPPHYPREGLNAPGGRAEVRVSCVIRSRGRLGDCVVVHEDPPGYGFAGSALKAARRSRVTRDSPVGARVGWTIRFALAAD